MEWLFDPVRKTLCHSTSDIQLPLSLYGGKRIVTCSHVVLVSNFMKLCHCEHWLDLKTVVWVSVEWAGNSIKWRDIQCFISDYFQSTPNLVHLSCSFESELTDGWIIHTGGLQHSPTLDKVERQTGLSCPTCPLCVPDTWGLRTFLGLTDPLSVGGGAGLCVGGEQRDRWEGLC